MIASHLIPNFPLAVWPLAFGSAGMLLLGVFAAVPVIIHFLSRRRTRRVAFSDLRFLREEEAQQAQRRGIQRGVTLAACAMAARAGLVGAYRSIDRRLIGRRALPVAGGDQHGQGKQVNESEWMAHNYSAVSVCSN